jgi:hypothetical protein
MTEDESMRFYDIYTAHQQSCEAIQQFSHILPCNDDLAPLIRVLSDSMTKTVADLGTAYITLLSRNSHT